MHVLIQSSSIQINVYQGTAAPIVESVLNGYNGTVFAYGQTGTGKTFTMEGVRTNKDLRGIIPNSFEHIFDKIHLSTGVVIKHTHTFILIHVLHAAHTHAYARTLHSSWV